MRKIDRRAGLRSARGLALLLLSAGALAMGAPPTPLDALRARLVAAALPAEGDGLAPPVVAAITAQAPWLVATQRADGSWPDVDYADSTDLSAWNASTALQRALMLGVAAHGAAASTAAGFCNASVLATRYWIARAPKNANWWWSQLGEISSVARALLLCPDGAAAAAAAAPDGLFSRTTEADVAAWPGANRVWGAVAFVLAAAVADNASAVDVGFALLRGGYAVSAPGEDGPQDDASFHQHGPLAQFSYAYGAHYLANALTMEGVALGTQWASAPSEWAVVASTLLDGSRWVMRGPEFALSTMGRHNTYFLRADAYGVVSGHCEEELGLVAPPTLSDHTTLTLPCSKPFFVLPEADHFFAAYPLFALAFPSAAPPLDSPLAVQYARALPPLFSLPRGDELRALHAQVLAAGPGVSGHRHFWLSDVAAHARPGFSTVLHMVSNRTLASECVNGEGLQNRAMGDGLLTTQVTGAEYRGAAPVWRWSLAPGVTALQDALAYDCGNAQVRGGSAFVGGASDSWRGTAAMALARNDANHSLVALKAWAFLDDGVVALGTAIASDGSRNVATAIEQRLLDGEVWFAQGAGAPAMLPPGSLLSAPDIAWVWHAGVAYALMAPLVPAPSATLAISSRSQSGSLANITQGPTDPITLPVFLAYLHHGNATAAAPASFAYAIIPGVAAPADAPTAVAAFLASTTIVVNGSGIGGSTNLCRASPNATTEWALHAVFWPPPAASPHHEAAQAARARAAPRASQSAASSPCPAVEVDAPAVVVVSLDAATSRVTIGASAPLREQAGSALHVTLVGVHAAGSACAPAANGSPGTVVTLTLPAGVVAGSSVVATCVLQAR
jgi:chondroitin AC lyase